MAPRYLAPRPKGPIVCQPEPVSKYRASDWQAMRAEIERLYVHERRSLRFVVRYMGSVHGFNASIAMYKKYIAKWSLYKNCRKSEAVQGPESKNKRNDQLDPAVDGRPSPLIKLPALCKRDKNSLVFLTSVHAWSLSFFQSTRRSAGTHPVRQGQLSAVEPWSSKAKESGLAFKLVTDMLHRGHGSLAGRLARRAFMLVEQMLTLEGPILMWNLLEMMHSMITMRQGQLFRMLLAHLTSLAEARMTKAHPLPTMLRGLCELVADLAVAVIPSNFAPVSSRSLPENSRVLCDHHVPTLLEQAWTLNAKLFFDHLDPVLLHLYLDINLELRSIQAPRAILALADKCLAHDKLHHQATGDCSGAYSNVLGQDAGASAEALSKSLLTARMDVPPPNGYEALRTSSLAAIREIENSTLHKNRASLSSNSAAADSPLILAGLIGAKLLRGWPAVTEPFVTRLGNDAVMPAVPRFHASTLACVMSALMDLSDAGGGGSPGLPSDRVEQMRTILALREYAGSPTDLQVVREQWLLKDALIAAGETREAEEIGRNAYSRLEAYTQDIPATFA
ncbi:uncharacterized protein JN550_009783 [Neoarthrinium moseri]|uniref:uncharacterized protein n=1 Tax=Neoarthrinium moseri TaxID=1658444 RepID=UPI001FDE9188|nr:uncharacterized protein JN550_009783 [Neoarthrinium moseri]KAI1863257.1 hypothetical protein JN550_009783 [Neoarthrinium moseri]